MIRTPWTDQRIILIDDDVAYVTTLKNRLTHLQARVVVATNGDEAVDTLLQAESDNDPFRLILLDMRVPRTNDQKVDTGFGKYFLLDLQNAFGISPQNTPIIIFTFYPDYEDCVECIRRGASDYLLKVPPSPPSPLPGYPPRNVPDSVDLLLKRCETWLSPPKTAGAEELEAQLAVHGSTLVDKYGGKYLGIVPPAAQAKLAASPEALAAEADRLERLGDVFVLPGDSWQEVRLRTLRNRVLRWEDVRIIHVPGPGMQSHG